MHFIFMYLHKESVTYVATSFRFQVFEVLMLLDFLFYTYILKETLCRKLTGQAQNP